MRKDSCISVFCRRLSQRALKTSKILCLSRVSRGTGISQSTECHPPIASSLQSEYSCVAKNKCTAMDHHSKHFREIQSDPVDAENIADPITAKSKQRVLVNTERSGQMRLISFSSIHAVILPLALLLTLTNYAHSSTMKSQTIPERPRLVTEALEKGENLYYFGLGSNMSRKKLENRGIGGTKIEIKTMGPAFVKNYRLAFNMKGFPPAEPGMGSLEPIDSSAKALLTYGPGECHGALVQLDPENYEKVMKSEGVNGEKDQGYDEIVVDAYPYENSETPVKAIALRARDHVRLDFDPCPSVRYMNILREGAKELGLKQCYQDFLKEHPVEIVPRWHRKQALFNIFFMFGVSRLTKSRKLMSLQSKLLFLFYTNDVSQKFKKALSIAVSTVVLLPGSIIGFTLYQALELLGKTPAPVKRMMDALDNE